MYRAFTCLTREHAAWAIPLATLVCWFACHTALRLLRQAREADGRERLGWLMAASLVAGSGIWSTHFIAMLGYDPGIGVSYDLPLTCLSFVVAVGTTLIALVLALQPRWPIGVGLAGVVVGLGTAAMHFIGMLGIRLPGSFVWQTPFVAAAVGVGCIFASAALLVNARALTRSPLLTAATLMTVAIEGLHFLAMMAAEAIPDPRLAAAADALPRGALALGIAAVTLAILAFSALALLAERLRRANDFLRQRRLISQEKTALLDTVLGNMDQGLMMVDAAGWVGVCNARAMALLDLPDSMMRSRPAFEAVRQYQVGQGEFVRSGEPVRHWVAESGLEGHADSYERERPNGTVLEIRSVPLPDGGMVRTYTDITPRKRAEETLRISQERLAMAQDAGSDGLWDCDVITGEAWSSDRWWSVLGYEPGELASHARTWRALIHPEDAGQAERILADHLSGRAASYECEHRMRRKDGSWAWMMTRGKVVARDPDGRALRFVGTQIDISARKEAEGKLAQMARHDALTDLPNRVLFHERLDQKLAEVCRSGTPCAVLCLDLDCFKAVNDTLGHSAGDALLREIAHRLRAVLPVEDALARVGGDEFAVLLDAGGDGETVAGVAERLIAAVQAPIAFGEHRMQVGLSIGIALAPEHGALGEQVYKRADLALYRAKAEGRNTYRFFDATMDEAVAERRVLERDLRHAIEREELTLHYQPQVGASTRVLLGFEALVRWAHPTRGLVSPADFIPVAEETGLIVALGEWVLRTACREAAGWTANLKVAVNLSPRQFQQADLPERVLTILTETGLSPERLELEVTESVIINDMARAQVILRRLKALGIRIAMDDFGTGYSSLATLQAFPFDKIKIDRSFVGRLEESPQAAVIVRAVLGLGRSLGMGVVAEGVETEAQMRFLAEACCDEVQGYLIGRPQPIEAFMSSVHGIGTDLRSPEEISRAA